jgi:hypothetical protein
MLGRQARIDACKVRLAFLVAVLIAMGLLAVVVIRVLRGAALVFIIVTAGL